MPTADRKDSGIAGDVRGTDAPDTSERAEAGSMERSWFDELVELLDPPAAVLDQAHRILAANSRFCELVETARESLVGCQIDDAVKGMLNVPAVRAALEAFTSDGGSAQENKTHVDLRLPDGRTIVAKIRGLPAIFRSARALLVAEHGAAPKTARPHESFQATPFNPWTSLSLEALHHDLRQPLQTLSLLQGLLASKESDPAFQKHIAQLGMAIEALGGMLNILEDIERPSTIMAAPHFIDFPIGPVLTRLRSEFGYHAEARGFSLRVVPSRAIVHSDPRLLEQTVRALLLILTKMIKRGRMLVGCRRQREKVSIQVWISGEAIPSPQQQAILRQFQLGTERSEMGVIHSTVKRLSTLLDLSIRARPHSGSGLAFSVDVPTRSISQANVMHDIPSHGVTVERGSAKGTVAVVSNNPLDREALTLLLKESGYEAVSVIADDDKVRLQAPRTMQPELIVGDFSSLAAHVAGRIVEELRSQLGQGTPAVLITGGSWGVAESDAISQPVAYLARPVTAEEITAQVAQSLDAARRHLAAPHARRRVASFQTTFIVDDDRLLRDGLSSLLKSRGERVEAYQTGESFLADYTPVRRGCLVLDDKLPGMRGIELLERLKVEGATLPTVMITGHGDVSIAVRAMKAGAIDYLEKPLFHERLLSAIDYALELDRGSAEALAHRQQLAECVRPR